MLKNQITINSRTDSMAGSDSMHKLYRSRNAVPLFNVNKYPRTTKIIGVGILAVFVVIGSVFGGIAGNKTYKFTSDGTSSINVGIGVFNYTNQSISIVNPEIRGLSFEEFISYVNELSAVKKFDLTRIAGENLSTALANGNAAEIELASCRADFVHEMIAAPDQRLAVIIGLIFAGFGAVGIILMAVFLLRGKINKNKNPSPETIEPLY